LKKLLLKVEIYWRVRIVESENKEVKRTRENFRVVTIFLLINHSYKSYILKLRYYFIIYFLLLDIFKIKKHFI